MPTVIITGGTKGIGRDLTAGFVAAGYSVIAAAREPSGVEDIDPARVRFVQCDVRNLGDHEKLVDAAREWTGGVDCYVNNAGFSAWRAIDEIDDPFFDEMMGVNLKGAFWGCRVAAGALRPGGTILNISSLAGKRGTPNNSMYVATKFGMNGMTQSLAKELGPRGIRVNALCPVLVRTPGLVEALAVKNSPAKGDPDGFLEAFRLRESPLARLPTGSEVAAMAVFLASQAASAISGQCINVDCGVLPQ